MSHATCSTAATLGMIIVSKFSKATISQCARQAFAIVLVFALLANVSFAQESTAGRQNQSRAQILQAATADDYGLPQVELAQSSAPAQPQAPDTPSSQSKGTITLPAGTKLPLGLLRPLSSSAAKPGRDVYLQVTFPVTVGNQVLVPPGTYIRGTIEKVIRVDRVHCVIEFTIQPASLIFFNGFTVPISGAITVSPTTAQALPPQPVNGGSVPVMAAVGTTPPTLPPLPPLPSHTGIIAAGVAGAVGVGILGIIFARHRGFEMQVGTPLEIILPAPLELDRATVADAVRHWNVEASAGSPNIVQPPAPRPAPEPASCYDPGTPDTVIHGIPPTPPTVIPGMNGAPDTVIPGTPGTPDTVIPGRPAGNYPC
ncbi:MAG TPA: hypothetical protein VFB79_18980 [Candidatus Angelobacter sp.]|nr:hypothetical protein [Candidatus Angelobacter sp.]